MATWADAEVDALERILSRAKAEALSERNDMARLSGAYAHRPGIIDRHSEAVKTIETIERLLVLTPTLRGRSNAGGHH